jgi:16S rRNA (cytosine1402-N4)-methyltransferase
MSNPCRSNCDRSPYDMAAVDEYSHRPVLLAEVIDALAVVSDGVYMDLTFGRGGHASAILARLGADGRLLVMDKDPAAIRAARERFGQDERVTILQGSYAGAATAAEVRGLSRRMNGILMDLGVSSAQLDDPRRGFSFRNDGPLDMRMDPASGESAAEWLARVSEHGEERFAARIARAITAERRLQAIDTTARLRAIVAAAHPAWEPGKDPATRTFQAIRIQVNHELEDLRLCLDRLVPLLAPGGRLAIISFHSLEDRMVKRFIRDESRGDPYPSGLPVPEAMLQPQLRPVGGAIHPGAEEVAYNPRARSAVLRVAERLQ